MRSELTPLFMCSVIALVLLTSGCHGPDPGVVRDTVNVDHAIVAGAQVSILNENGDIQVRTTSGDRVLVEAEKASSAGEGQFDLVDVVFTEDGDDLLVQVVFEPTARDISVDLDVRVPEDVEVVQVSTANGNIDVTGTRGDADLTTANGWVTVVGIEGFVTISSGNGRVEVIDTTGVGNVTTSNGDLRLDIRAIAGDVELRATNGGISVSVSPAIDADVVITTTNGNIDYHDTVLDVTLEEPRRVEGTVGDGGAGLTLAATNGDVYFYELM